MVSRLAHILRHMLGALFVLTLGDTGYAQILQWNLEATVIEIEDPEKAFPDLRLGDPVRGFLRYSLSTPPTGEDPQSASYDHDPAFEVAGMVIENPRDESEIVFAADQSLFTLVGISNDDEDPEISDEKFDGIFVLQPVASDGEFFPSVISVDLFGPPEVLADTSLPRELRLEDWPEAVIVYFDLFSGVFIGAEIHTLSAVMVPSLAGDFNGSGLVDAADYAVWRKGLGTSSEQADYDEWRANFGATLGSVAPALGAAGGSQAAVPEPSTTLLAAMALVALARMRTLPFPGKSEVWISCGNMIESSMAHRAPFPIRISATESTDIAD
jgi:hypothetical protein